MPDDAWRGDDEPTGRAPQRATPRFNGIPWYWWCVGAGLLALLIVTYLGLI